jgi:tape measure domain-containing protein
LISLGSINFGVTPDISKLAAATQAIQNFGGVVSRMAASTGQGAQAAAKGLRAQELAAIKAYMASRQLYDQMNKAGAPLAQIQQLVQKMNGFVNATTQGKLSALEFQRAQERLALGMSNSKRTFDEFTAGQKAHQAGLAASTGFYRNADAAAARYASTVGSLERVQSRLTNAAVRAGAPASILSGTTSALSNVKTTAANPTASRTDQTQALVAYRAEVLKAQQAIKALSDAHVPAERTTSAMSKALHDAAKGASLYTGPLGGVSTRINILSSLLNENNLAFVAVTAGVVAATFAFIHLSERIVNLERDLQGATRVLDVINQNTTGSALQLRFLAETANQAGVGFKELVKPYTEWTTAIKGTYLEGQRGNQIFAQMVQAQGELHNSAEQISATFANLRRMLSSNSVTAREFRTTLEHTMPGIARVIAKEFGVSIDKLDQLRKNGLQVETTIERIARAYVNSLGGMGHAVEGIAAQEARWHNAQSTLLDTVDKVFGISTRYEKTLGALTQWVNDFARGSGPLVGILEGIGAGLGLITAGVVIAGLAKLGGAIRAVAASATLAEFAIAGTMGLGKLAIAAAGAAAGLAAAKLIIDEIDAAAKKSGMGIDGIGSSLAGAKPKLDEFLRDQRKANVKDTVSARLYQPDVEDAIKKQEAQIDSLKKLALESGEADKKSADATMDAYNKKVKAAEDAVEAAKKAAAAFGTLNTHAFEAGGGKTEGGKISMRAGDLTGGYTPPKVDLPPMPDIPGWSTSTQEAIKKVQDAKKVLADLRAQRKEVDELSQTVNIAKPAEPNRTDQQDKALLKAREELSKYESELGKMGQGQAALDKWKEEFDITKEVQKYKDNLDQAANGNKTYATESAAALTKLEAAFRKVHEAQYDMAHITTPGMLLESTFKGLSSSVNTFVDAVAAGTANMKTLGDIGKSVILGLIKQFLQLAVMNPLQNALFGSNEKTFGMSVSGGSGVGGLIGKLLGGFTGGGSGGGGDGAGGGGGFFASLSKLFGGGFFGMPTAALGMSVTEGGMRFASGGVFSHPTTFATPRGPVLGGEAGPEALVPLTRMAGGRLGVHMKSDSPEHPTSSPIAVHFHGAPEGTKVHESEDAGGGKRLDAYFTDMTAGAVARTGGPVQRAMGSTYGLAPRTIRRGGA